MYGCLDTKKRVEASGSCVGGGHGRCLRALSGVFDMTDNRLRYAWLCLVAALTWASTQTRASTLRDAEFFLVWGLRGGGFHGELRVENGEIRSIGTHQWEPRDVLRRHGTHRVSWIGNVHNGTDGLQLRVSGDSNTVFRLRFTRPYALEAVLTWKDVTQGAGKVLPLGNLDFVAYGPGDVRRGPRTTRFVTVPPLYEPPRVPTESVVALTDAPPAERQAVRVALSDRPPGKLIAHRAARGNGRLYVALACPKGPLAGTAEIAYGPQRATRRPVDGRIWLSLPPRIGTLELAVSHPTEDGGRQDAHLTVPTTLVEIRGPKLYLNGEPFLIKGTLPRDINDADAKYVKSLGANTLRAKTEGDFDHVARHDFMAIARCHSGPGKICKKAPTTQAFEKGLTKYVHRSLPLTRQAAMNPRTLLIQLGNEQATGVDPWLYRTRPPHSFERLDRMLAVLYNRIKPMDPMVPLGYSNCAFGYIAPDFLDVYLHNTYLAKDRGWPPIETYMKLQGCDARPYIHTEFGANVYMPQAHLGAANSPVLEKLHARNYRHRWRTYLAAGTIGGTNYCLYDYDYAKAKPIAWGDRGFANFGIMTFDRKPKLACWELLHLWRDFEIDVLEAPDASDSEAPREPKDDDASRPLLVRYRREYRARDCRLTVRTDGGEKTIRLSDFPPRSQRRVPWTDRARGSKALPSFRWRMDYTTHGGLGMVARGAWPPDVEADDFLASLEGRRTYSFLRELFAAEVVGTDGQPAPPTFKEMERDDGIVPVAFRTPDGVVYLTLFSRKKPAKGVYRHGVSLDVAFTGDVVAVDELTGEPVDTPVRYERRPGGLRLEDLRVPYLPAAVHGRSIEPFPLPVFRITQRVRNEQRG